MPYHYEYRGQIVSLEPDPAYVAVRFAHSPFKLLSAAADDWFGPDPLAGAIAIPGESYTLFPADHAPGLLHTLSVGEDKAETGIVKAAPVFSFGAQKALATDRIIAGIADDAPAARAYLAENGCEVLRTRADVHVIRIPPDRDPFEVAEAVRQFDGVSYAEPDFVIMMPRPAYEAEGQAGDGAVETGVEIDPGIMRPPGPDALSALEAARARSAREASAGTAAMASQPMLWAGPAEPAAYRLPSYAFALIGADRAWEKQPGDASVAIAILDDGVDTAHPDLGRWLATSYDATTGASPSPPPNGWDGHGTACAGLAAAVPHDAGGLRGVAAGCVLMPVRLARSAAAGGWWSTSTEIIADAIEWAWQHGAAVLSCSWECAPKTTQIDNALRDARTRGRSGLGAVVVVAAGNAGGPVAYPAELEGVLAVSASDAQDQFKRSAASGDWGSNHGPEIDLCAPGVDNFTTRIGGGYRTFSGTSSACPLVAGAAALVLCADPRLSEGDVRTILTDSADKIGHDPYVHGRNRWCGYGRLNVAQAVSLALKERPSPPGGARPDAPGTSAP